MSDLENPGKGEETERKDEGFRPVTRPVPFGEIPPMRENFSKYGSSAPDNIKAMKSIGEFMAFGGKTTVKLLLAQKTPPLGHTFEMTSPVPMTSQPVFPPTVRQATSVKILGGTEGLLAAKQKLDRIKESIAHPSSTQPSQGTTSAGTPEPAGDPKPPISIERLVFLERVERIMASEARIKEIEAENKTLVGMVTRLQKELDELKAKHSKNP